MSREVIERIILRASNDREFRHQMRTNPEDALRDYELAPEERAALLKRDPSAIAALGVDARVSRIFAGMVDADAAYSPKK